MPFCFPDKIVCYAVLFTSSLPLLHSGIGILQHKYDDDYVYKRLLFRESRKKVKQNWFTVILKVSVIVLFMFFALLQIILHQIYDNHYQVVSIVECLYMLSYAVQIMLVTYDALYYGGTTAISKINLLVNIVSFGLFVGTIYYEDQIMKEEDFLTSNICWIIFIIRGVLQILFLIGLIAHSSDKRQIIHEHVGIQEKSSTMDSENIVRAPPTRGDNLFTFSGDPYAQGDLTKLLLDPEKITEVTVKAYRESQLYEKRTIIYQIEYKWNGVQRTVYRSFREFLAFNYDMCFANPQILMPTFPMKKDQNQYLTQQDIDERRIQLDVFLKGILYRFGQHKYLEKFLNLNQDTPQYKQIHEQQKQKKITISRSSEKSHTTSRRTYEDNIPETIWEGIGEDEESIVAEKDKRKMKRITSQMQFKNEILEKHYSLDNRRKDSSDQQSEEEKTSQQDHTLHEAP